MKYPIIRLTPEQKLELKEFIKKYPSPWQIAKRLEAVRLLDTGLSSKTVAQQLCVNTEIIYKYVKTFRTKGFEGLLCLEKPGKESKLSELQLLEIEKYIKNCRKEKIRCTASDQVRFVKTQFGIDIGEKWLYKRLLLRKHSHLEKVIPLITAASYFSLRFSLHVLFGHPHLNLLLRAS